MVLAGTVLVTVGNVFLRWSIGEALDTGNLQISLLIITAVLLILAQLVSYIRQMLFVKVQKNIYGKIQSKVLHGRMEELGKSSLGAVTAYYTSDVGQIDSFANRVVGNTFPDLVGSPGKHHVPGNHPGKPGLREGYQPGTDGGSLREGRHP